MKTLERKRARKPRSDGRLGLTVLLEPELMDALEQRAALHGHSLTAHAARILAGLAPALTLTGQRAA